MCSGTCQQSYFFSFLSFFTWARVPRDRWVFHNVLLQGSSPGFFSSLIWIYGGLFKVWSHTLEHSGTSGWWDWGGGGILQIIGNFRSFGKGINKPLPYPAREIFLFRSEVVTVVLIVSAVFSSFDLKKILKLFCYQFLSSCSNGVTFRR